MNDPTLWLTVEEIAQTLGITTYAVHKRLKRNSHGFTTRKVGRKLLILRSDFENSDWRLPR